MTTTELNNFNQTMVGNTQNTGVANTSTPGVFTGAKSVNFLGTPAQATNPAPTIVSNYNTAGKVNEVTDKFNNLSTPYQQAPQNQGMFGVDQETINNFKQANPNLDFTREDAEYAKQADMQKSYYTPEAEYAMKGFDSLKTESDDITKQYLQQTQDKYKQLQEDQKIANSQAQNAALMALGTQGGSGSPTDRNSYVQSVIDQGQRKLQALNLEERGVYLEALKAQKDENYKLFSDKVKQLDVVRNAKIAEAQAFNQKVQEQAEKVKEEALTAQKQVAISGLYDKGVTDPAQLLKTLKSQGVNASLKEVTDATALLSGLGGTGIIGEYNFAKSQGYTGTFNEYQDEDANRKIQVAAASQNPDRILTATEAQALGVPFGTTANQAYGKTITKPPTEAQTREAVYAKRLGDTNPIIDTMESTISGMNSGSFAYQKMLEDTTVGNSFVSDDIKQIRQAERNFATAVLRRESGASISPTEFSTLEKQYFPRPGDDVKTLAQKKQNRATVEKEFVKAAGPAYGAEVSTPSIGEQTQQSEQQAESTVREYLLDKPDIQLKANTMIDEYIKKKGTEPSSLEILQMLGIPSKQAFNTVVGDTNLSQGIVGGINLKGYAVDPNQIKSVATIYDKVPDSNNVLDFDTYIKSVAPKSKITGQDILTVANQYQLDPKAILALMQHESRIGTSSVALANNNYGGITWSPTYAKNNPGVTKGTPRPANEGGYYVKFATPLDGLMAQAKLLSNRKIA